MERRRAARIWGATIAAGLLASTVLGGCPARHSRRKGDPAAALAKRVEASVSSRKRYMASLRYTAAHVPMGGTATSSGAIPDDDIIRVGNANLRYQAPDRLVIEGSVRQAVFDQEAWMAAEFFLIFDGRFVQAMIAGGAPPESKTSTSPIAQKGLLQMSQTDLRLPGEPFAVEFDPPEIGLERGKELLGTLASLLQRYEWSGGVAEEKIGRADCLKISGIRSLEALLGDLFLRRGPMVFQAIGAAEALKDDRLALENALAQVASLLWNQQSIQLWVTSSDLMPIKVMFGSNKDKPATSLELSWNFEDPTPVELYDSSPTREVEDLTAQMRELRRLRMAAATQSRWAEPTRRMLATMLGLKLSGPPLPAELGSAFSQL